MLIRWNEKTAPNGETIAENISVAVREGLNELQFPFYVDFFASESKLVKKHLTAILTITLAELLLHGRLLRRDGQVDHFHRGYMGQRLLSQPKLIT